MNRIKVDILNDEYWYGMDVSLGVKMPLSATSKIKIDLRRSHSVNQTAPLLVSNMGRYIWSYDGFEAVFKSGVIKCRNEVGKHDIELYDGYADLKGAYLAASERYFPSNGRYPDETMFRVPQYCTWIELGTNQTQEGILDYARSIVASGMPAGELIIDDGWQTSFGSWNFDPKKIPQPKKLVDELHGMGFKVILWICPFIREGSFDYNYLKYGDLLVKSRSGKIALRKWWNGKDALLDMSNPDTRAWFEEKCENLINEYGIDGFKQDAGDAFYYKNDDITYDAVDANTQSRLWCESAEKYSFNEIRACFGCGGLGIAQRLADKNHSFGNDGLKSLVPNALLQGLLGYPYSCPDMIGGGQIGDFGKGKDGKYNDELFVRYAEASALMPMMQYSHSVWRLDNEYASKLCIDACELHEQYASYIVELVKKAAVSGEPVIRYLEYEFPKQGFAEVTDMFMLGDKYLVAPVVNEGQFRKKVRLPGGRWRYVDGKVYSGEADVEAGIDVLPVFAKL